MTKNSKNNYLYGLVIVGVVASLGQLIRPTLFGFDSYANLACSRGIDCGMLGSQQAMVAILKMLPADILIYKLFMLFLLIGSLFALYFFAKRFLSPMTSFYAVLLTIGLSPILVFRFAEFENDLFAYFLLFWALYFVFSSKLVPKIASTILFVVAFIFFSASLVYLPIFALAWWIYLIPALGFGVFAFSYWSSVLVGNPNFATENILLGGVFQFFLWFFSFPFFVSHKDWRLVVGGVVTLVLATLSPQLMLFVVPFVVLGMGKLLDFFEKRENLTILLIVIAVFCLVSYQVAVFNQQPTQEDDGFVSFLVTTAKDKNIPFTADFTYDYWIENAYNKRLPYSYQSLKDYNTGKIFKINGRDYTQLERPYLVLTQLDTNCTLLKESPHDSKKIYLCD